MVLAFGAVPAAMRTGFYKVDFMGFLPLRL
jgi:hypothetical protein